MPDESLSSHRIVRECSEYRCRRIPAGFRHPSKQLFSFRNEFTPTEVSCVGRRPRQKPAKKARRMSDAKIVIVDDDGAAAAHLEECLQNLGYRVCAAVSCGHEALETAAAARPDLALVDLGLEGELTGPETGERIGRRFGVPVVYLTGEAGEELLQRAQATGPFGYVPRPFDQRQLRLTLLTALSLHERERRQRETETRLKRIVRKYKGLTRFMKAMFDSMSESVIAFDENMVPFFYNSSVVRMGGDPRVKDIHKWAAKYGIFNPDGKTLFSVEDLPLIPALKGKAPDEIELFIRNRQTPEGFHLSLRCSPLPEGTDVAKGALMVGRDITKLKRAEAELEKTMGDLRYQIELMETTFKSISDGIVVADAEGKFLYVNPAAEQIVGMGILDGPPEEWAERYGTYHPDRDTPMKTEDLPLIRAIRRGESVDEEDMFIRNPEKPKGIFIRGSARPLLDNIGGIRGGVIIFRDVTERRLAEEALARAFAQGRSEIVETILHNIGNAINSVTTGIETVRRSLVNDPVGRRLAALAAAVREHREDWLDYIAADPQGRKVMPFIVELAASSSRRNEELMKTVGRVRDRGNHIAEIVRTQKTLARYGMDRKDVDLHEALAGAVRVLRDSLNKRGIRVAIECDGAPPQIRIEESQFHQMLVNLVKNSLEAIDELAAAQGLDDTRGLEETPRIRIRARAGEEFLDLEVADTGIGIGNRDTGVLFSPGYTTKESGSGLGLHSAANFVIGLGGRIQPLSAGSGKGTTMRVTLPLSKVAPHPTAATD